MVEVILEPTRNSSKKKYNNNKLKFFISKQDMIFGKRNDCDFCPIAIVASKVLGQPVKVTERYLWPDNGGVIALPVKAREFIRKFDDKKTTIASLKPFSFTIDMGE